MKLKFLLVIAGAGILAACQPVNRYADLTLHKSVPQNGTIMLSEAGNVRPDCTSTGPVDVQAIESPLHGKVSIVKTTGFLSYGPFNLRSACAKRKVPMVRVNYTADRGYLGPDKVSIRHIFSDGTERIRRYQLEVK